MYFSESLKTLASTVGLSLNPYYVGCTSRRAENVHPLFSIESLNPYYVGCTSRSNMENAKCMTIHSLNPYYVGCTSRRLPS